MSLKPNKNFEKLPKDYLFSRIKKKEAEWLKNRPPVNSGAGGGDNEDPFLKGFNS